MHMVDGWLAEAKRVPSPNFNQRPQNACVNLLVIHNISLPPAQFNNCYIEQFFQNTLPTNDHPYFDTLIGVEVSAHFLIKRSGELIQFVSCDDRAWHAGKSQFCGIENCNDFSIGIELEGTDTLPYTSQQYAILAELTRCIQNHYPDVTSDRIVGHRDIAPDRKTDPGESFDWQYFHQCLVHHS